MNLVIVLVTYFAYFTSVKALFENENCTMLANNKYGRCIKLQECDFAIDLLKKNQKPDTCGFIGSVPLVCCPNELKTSKPGEISKKKCNEYFDVDSQVYTISVDLGQKALSKEFPHMVAIGYGNKNTEIVWLCGGTLISHRFVLSAAHCVDSLEYGPAAWVRLGDLDLKNTTEDANPQDIKIQQIYHHPKYIPASHYHDIALFKMKQRTSFDSFFKPACLQIEKKMAVTTLGATGWGKMGFLGESSSHLMKIDLDIVDHQVCAKRYENVSKRKLQNGIVDDLQICAGKKIGGDTCPGDSGGPLHYKIEGDGVLVKHFIVAGITSFGKGCGGGTNTVGVYTRVSAYLDWIENIVWKEDD